MYKISIIAPCYNSAGYIENLVNNLSLQTCKDFEVVFVDDCSKDETYELLQNITAGRNFKCKIIKNEINSGPGISRNNGIDVAEGEYITFVDSDDYIDKDTILLLSETIAAYQRPDAILYDYYRTNGKNDIPCSTIPGVEEGVVSVSDALLYSKGATWCKVYNREFILRNSIRFPRLNTNEDFAFNKTALSYCDSVVYLKKHLYYYVYNPNSLVNRKRGRNDNAKVACEILSRDMNPEYKSSVCYFKATIYLYGAVQSMIRRRDDKNEIRKFIDDFNAENGEWEEAIQSYRVGKFQRYMLRLIKKKKLTQLTMIIGMRDIFKKAFMQ